MATTLLTIELTPDARRDLSFIGEQLKTDDADAIGNAIGTEAELLEAIARDAKVVIVEKDGRQRELVVKPRAGMNGGRHQDSR